MKLFISSILLTLSACSTFQDAPEVAGEDPATPEVIAGTMHELTKCYDTNDFEGFVALFAPRATYQGNRVADSIDKWKAGFSVPGQSWEFTKVNIAGARASAWFVEKSTRYCSGPAYWSFDPDGRIRSVEAVCARTDPDVPPVVGRGADPSLVGQGLDIATTGAALTAGLVEANPIGAAAGAPVFAGVKLVATQYAERLPLGECYEMKAGLAASGWGAAGWNACMIAASPAGPGALISCGLAAVAAGAVSASQFGDDALMHCWKPLKGVEGGRYKRINAAGINPAD